MLPKSGRLTRVSFPRGRARTRLSFSWGSVSVFEAEGKKERAAVVVSKKALAKAHDRNRMRRRLYEALARALPEKNYTVVVYPRREALTAPFKTLVADLKRILT